MKRSLFAAFTLAAALSAAGCCYSPAYVDPWTGIPCGGSWQPVCGGPCDPLGLGCLFGGCWGGYYGGYGYGVQGYGQPGLGQQQCADPCTAPLPQFGGYGAPVYQQPGTFVNDGCVGCGSGMPGGTLVPEGVPAESLSPSPDPMNKTGPQKSSGGSSTYVVPQPAPVPTIQGASARPILQAF